MNLLQREAHKRFIDLVAKDDPLHTGPFTVTTIDPTNDDNDKKLFYSGLIHKL